MQAIVLSTSGALSGLHSFWQLRRYLYALTLLVTALWLSGCSVKADPKVRRIALQQQWVLNPGDEIAGSSVAGSLGDISLHLKNAKVKAPFDGELAPSEIEQCALYSTPEIPAYLFRLCGLRKFSYGEVKAGRLMGRGRYISFATLRRQPDGTWIIVEPAKSVLERLLGAKP